MPTRTRKGREERRNSHVGRTRRPDLRKMYGRELPEVRPGQFRFRLLLIRPAHPTRTTIPLDEVVESFDWTDDGSILNGNLSLVRPDPEKPESLPIGVGHRVRCQVRWAGGWYTLWDMRCAAPQIDSGSGTVSVALKDDMALINRTRRDWSFRKTKQRKRGWYAHEIVREVCRREGIRIGALARGKSLQTLKRKRTSALDVIREAYGHERDKTGVRFIIRLRNGKLEVIPLQRNKTLYVFEEQIERALIEQRAAQRPVTVIEGRGRVNGKKIKHTEYRPQIVRRFGRVTEEKDYGKVASHAELRQKVRRDLAKKIRVKRTAQLSVPGIPFVRRGDVARWRTFEAGWSGSSLSSRDRSFVYVTSVSHQVSSQGYTMDLSVVQDDPYVADEKRQDREARDRAKKRRQRRRR